MGFVHHITYDVPTPMHVTFFPQNKLAKWVKTHNEHPFAKLYDFTILLDLL